MDVSIVGSPGYLRELTVNGVDYVPTTPVTVTEKDSLSLKFSGSNIILIVKSPNLRKWYEFWKPKFDVIEYEYVRK